MRKSASGLKTYSDFVRKTILDRFSEYPYGCLSGSFSMVELYVTLYLNHADTEKILRRDPSRLRVLPKSTSALAFYATLAAAGIMPRDLLHRYGTGRLAITYRAGTPGVETTHYTLGPYLGTAVGLALASKIKAVPYPVICFMGDGELQENVDQAAKCAANFELDNLTVVIDCNALQSYYPTVEGDPTMAPDSGGSLNRQRNFWTACGWHAIEIQGHDFDDILSAYDQIGRTGSPYVILARTVKGRGLGDAEGKLGFQHHIDQQTLESLRNHYSPEKKTIRFRSMETRSDKKPVIYPGLDLPCLENSRGTMRNTLAEWMEAFKRRNPSNIFTIDSDCRNIFGDAYTRKPLTASDYTRQHIFPGLNERLSLTVAKGMAYEGLYPVVGSRANNLTDTCEEWKAICMDSLPVLLVGTRPGAIQADWGPSKCSFMDINIMDCPGGTIYQPANSDDLVWLLEILYADPCRHLPAYIRLPDFENGNSMPAKNDPRAWKKGYCIISGSEYRSEYSAVVASGDSLQQVAEIVDKYGAGHSIKVINLFNLTRISFEQFREDLSGASRIVSVIEAKSNSISEMIFKALAPDQKAVYTPMGIDNAVYLSDTDAVKKHGYYAARDYVLKEKSMDAHAIASRMGMGEKGEG